MSQRPCGWGLRGGRRYATGRARPRVAGRPCSPAWSARSNARRPTFAHGVGPSAPLAALHLPLRDLTTAPIGELASGEHRALLLDLFAWMRSGFGFAVDIRGMACGGLVPSAKRLSLIIAATGDGAVPLAQAEALAAALTDFLVQPRPARALGSADEGGT
ncbi:hypothetical protein [Actinomadura nitritigenes]|uniref:Uncharacterized protein n=1 Tax=Actinomadura nitritigenes TaxID=134602 RepID=A0ABS3R5M5_9ACTN|nr:hypothetical protein [Actinomadura nitritigenes]MBO2441395.1 hypothetical protein [Actinomadura nitritigenes]